MPEHLFIGIMYSRPNGRAPFCSGEAFQFFSDFDAGQEARRFCSSFETTKVKLHHLDPILDQVALEIIDLFKTRLNTLKISWAVARL